MVENLAGDAREEGGPAYWCVGYDGRIGYTADDGYNVRWDFLPLPPARAQEIAAELSASGEWLPDLCRELCELAGMADEWERSDGEGFEGVVYAAAEKLGVEI